MIECVPDSQSRDQIGKATDISLYQYFINKYGDEDTAQFQAVSVSTSDVHGSLTVLCLAKTILMDHFMDFNIFVPTQTTCIFMDCLKA